MKQWTQREAVACECAREAITDLMAIRTEEIATEVRRSQPDSARLEYLRSERKRLAQERAAIHVDDHAEIRRIRGKYGAQIRAYRAEHHNAK
jgi:hypothetical protein